MNREIIFRGKDIKGNWYEGLLAHNIAKDEWYISNKAGISTAYQVRPETIGQFTGLTDKNDTKIFDGDVVRICRQFGKFLYGEDNYVCKYDANSASFKFYYIMPEDIADVNEYAMIGNGAALSDMGRDFTIEVIGNIWDNPELMSVVEKSENVEK